MNIENNIEIFKFDNMGRGIGYVNNKIVFVNNTLPGEIVNIKIIKEFKKYLIGNVINYLKISNDRVNVPCPYYNNCGGCCLQHINYEKYIEYNKNNLKSILKKYSNIDIEPIIIKNDSIFKYRNKISLKIKNYEWGYYNEITHDFVSIDKCLLASEIINKIIEQRSLFNINNGTIIIRSNFKNELLICINSDKCDININKLNILFNIKGIILNDKVIYGNDYFIDSVKDLNFKVNYKSFFQVNRYILSKVFEILNKECNGKNLLDLYCGVGVLGLCVANKFKNIIGIEINQNSISDAKFNSNLNIINNAKYYVGDTKKVLDDIDIKFDTIIVDPPRSGLDNKTINYVMESDSKNIIYMSCDEVTLSRDLNILKEKYIIKNIYLLDMFTNTKHVECVCVLNRR